MNAEDRKSFNDDAKMLEYGILRIKTRIKREIGKIDDKQNDAPL